MKIPLEQINEQVLILKAQMGDDEAFAELTERYRGKLHYYIRRFLDRHDLAEDALQDVWLTAYRKIGKLRIPEAFSVWLYRIARSQAVNRAREEGRYAALPEGFDPPVDTDASEDESTFTIEDASLVHRALDRLKLPHREALVLRFIEDMSYQEIAAVTGLNPGTIKSRLHYAKLALRKELEVLRNEKQQ